jgi:hypothetical protein
MRMRARGAVIVFFIQILSYLYCPSSQKVHSPGSLIDNLNGMEIYWGAAAGTTVQFLRTATRPESLQKIKRRKRLNTEDEMVRKRALGMVICLVLILGTSLARDGAEKPLAAPQLIQAIAAEISGEIAFRYTVRISEFDRIQANAGWHEAAVWIKTELEKMGYADALIEGWPSNGSTRYYTYKAPIGWRAERAELWMLQPRRERLCSYEEIPLTLVKHSGSGLVEAELVDVGTGMGEEAYRGKDVKGKIVLSTGASGEVMRQACQQRGAVGVITYFAPDVRPGYPEMIRYTAFWPGWEERDRLGLGFNVSKNQGAALKRMLEEGHKVVLKAEVEAEFFETQIEALSASFPGAEEPEKEVMIVGHLCHPSPSANDNGSGSAGMLEIARALKRLVGGGVLLAPRRTIRFLWIPEFSGTVPYIRAHLERTRNTLAAVNLDMIGEDLHKTGGVFNIVLTPDSLPSFLNDVVVNFTRAVGGPATQPRSPGPTPRRSMSSGIRWPASSWQSLRRSCSLRTGITTPRRQPWPLPWRRWRRPTGQRQAGSTGKLAPG